MSSSSMRERVSTSVTHTVNVVQEKGRRFKRDAMVTKYVVKVSLGVAGSRPRLEWQVARRYSHFRSNHTALASMFSQHRLPKLPPKQLVPAAASAAATATLVADRLVALDAYLKRLVALPGVGSCTQMLTFLGAYQGMQTSWFAQANWRQTMSDEASNLDSRPSSPWGSPGGASSGGGGEEAATPMFAFDGSDAAEAAWELATLHGSGGGARADDAAQAQELLESLGLQPVLESYVANFEQLSFASRPDVAAAMTLRFLNGLEAAAAVDCNFRCSETVACRVLKRRPGARRMGGRAGPA